MTVLQITSFGGEVPSASSRTLPPGSARTARNLHPKLVEFRPLNEPLDVATVAVSNPLALHRLNRNANGTFATNMSTGWLAYPQVRSFANGQINDDLTGRVYYSFDDGSAPPRVMDATAVDKPLGIPVPDAPQVTLIVGDEFTPEEYDAATTLKVAEVAAAVRANAAFQLAGAYEVSSATPGYLAKGITGWVDAEVVDSGTGLASGAAAISAPERSPYHTRAYKFLSKDDAMADSYVAGAPLSAFSWVNDPAAGAVWAMSGASGSIPSWQAASTWHANITFRGAVRAYFVKEAALKTALLAIKRSPEGVTEPIDPATGATAVRPLLTSENADALVRLVVDYTALDGDQISGQMATFVTKVGELRTLLDGGFSKSEAATMATFYAKSTTVTRMDAAFTLAAKALFADAAKVYNDNFVPPTSPEGNGP